MKSTPIPKRKFEPISLVYEPGQLFLYIKLLKMDRIYNDKFEVKIKRTGAELCSFKSLGKQQEYIWQGDPSFWGSHAPILFPVIGCLKDGIIKHKGNEHQLSKHGFVRNNPKLQLIAQTNNSAEYELKWDHESLAAYPFKFNFRVKYTLESNTLTLEHTVLNEGDESMYYSLGGHPAFNCPFHANEAYSDYHIEFEETENSQTWEVLNSGLIGKRTFSALDGTNRLPLHDHIFDKDALIFKDLKSRKVSLASSKHSKRIEMQFESFPYLGIWAKPGAPFVCIEPWQGIADNESASGIISEKEGIMKLQAGKSHAAGYSISIFE